MPLEYGALSEGFALEQANTWNTAVAVGANDGLTIRSFRQLPGSGKIADPRVDLENPWGDTPDIGPELQAFGIDFDLYYGGGCGDVLALMFQHAETVVNNTGSYTHPMHVQTGSTYFGTACKGVRSGAKWHEYKSVMPRVLTLEGAGQGRVTASMEFVADQREKDSSTHTTTDSPPPKR